MPRRRPRSPQPRPARRRAAGFNLIEVMVSMGIFVIAFVAVASIFPTAITLQREATQTVDDRAAEVSAEAIARSLKLVAGDLIADVNVPAGDEYLVQPLLDDVDAAPALEDIPFPMRTFGADATNALAPEARRYVWIPMIQPIANPLVDKDSWRLFIAVLRRDLTDGDAIFSDPAKSIPTWASDGDDWSSTPSDDSESTFPGLLRQGVTATASTGRFDFANADGDGNLFLVERDEFIDENGNIYVVDVADASGVNITGVIPENRFDPSGGLPAVIWFAPRPFADGSTTIRPDDAPSPLVAIIEVSDAIIN